MKLAWVSFPLSRLSDISKECLLGSRVPDRIAIPPARLLVVEKDKLPYKIVKGRANVVDKLAAEDTPCYRWSLNDVQLEDIAAALNIELTFDAIRLTFAKSLDFAVNRFQMSICPIKFRANPCECIVHSVKSMQSPLIAGR